MYDVIDIKNRLWKSFKQSAPTIMELAQNRIVDLRSKSGYDKTNIIFREADIAGNKSHFLAQKIQDKEGIEQSDVTGGFEIRKIIKDVPYAMLHERGGDIGYTNRKAQRARMFITMKALGIYQRDVKKNPNVRSYPARQYVHKGLDSITPRELGRPIIAQIQKEFNKETVIVIGDK